jgi:Ca2+:H+ antiporter
MPRPSWTTVTPPVAAVALAIAWGKHPSAAVLTLLAVLLVCAVLAAASRSARSSSRSR